MGFGEEKKDDHGLSGIVDESDSIDEGKEKIVKFAEVEAEKKDAQLDQERSRQQLLSKIARLTEVLNEAQQQVQEEKDKRKKSKANNEKKRRGQEKKTEQTGI